MTSTSKYPSRSEIESTFKHLQSGDFESFFKHVDTNVDWTVQGTHPCAGHYTNLQDFLDGAITRLSKIMKNGIPLAVRNVVGGGDEPWAVVELIANAECKNGFKFENTYAWVVRFDETGKIVQVRAYLDSWMVRQAIIENETPSHRAPVPHIG